jgi:pectate lyase
MPTLRRMKLALVRYGDYLACVALLLSSVIATAAFLAPTLEGQIDALNVRHDQGFAYVAAAPSSFSRLYRLRDDWMTNSKASRLRLFEDGKPLGPAHAPLAHVNQLGAGRYVHWGREIWFSASDGTDPRVNGRRYYLR